jgi:sugar phosphate isomerase/epimerase
MLHWNNKMVPKLALRNIFSGTDKLGQFARNYGFAGIDWSFDLETLPKTPSEESLWVKDLSCIKDFEIRYHCPFYQIDIGHNDPEEARKAENTFRRIVRMVSKAGGEFLTIHIGLGHNTTEPLSWDTTISNLRQLVQFGAEHGVTICLENLAWGWSSRPNLFEKMIRKSGAAVTFDIGHALASESIQTQYYKIEDFLTPHEGRVLNAHVYHIETPDLGHVPPERLEDIEERLDLLQTVACNWWVLELKEPKGLLHTKKLIDAYLTRLDTRQQNLENSLMKTAAKNQ